MDAHETLRATTTAEVASGAALGSGARPVGLEAFQPPGLCTGMISNVGLAV